MKRAALALLVVGPVLAVGCYGLGPKMTLPEGRRETGRAFLVGAAPEEEGYGLYSYLLLGSRSEASRARSEKAIASYLETIVPMTTMEEYLPREQLNVTYLPVTELPPPGVTEVCPGPQCAGPPLAGAAAWLLAHYDYARARVILARLPGAHRSGPYIVSYTRPLSAGGAVSHEYLDQDLSTVREELVSLWVSEFLVQVAQTHYWERDRLRELAMALRNAIAVAAAKSGDVRDGMDRWIVWKR
jgi:hypothetical protein